MVAAPLTLPDLNALDQSALRAINGGAIIDHDPPREGRLVAVQKGTTSWPGEPASKPRAE
jgi:hypothetical protein